MDSEDKDLIHQDLIGSCMIEPYEIVRAPKQKVSRDLFYRNEKRGELIVTAETISKKNICKLNLFRI